MRWLPFVYQYSLEFVVFLIGIVIALKSKQFRPSETRGKVYLGLMVATFLFYFLLQGFMQFILPDL
ncbi:hypothetical protein JXJ21_10625 [candidate division KSB1 bacterium]|nr:hypothetical protein [candidate division KSB1 bacterium]